ncbi:ABC transporter permease [Rathayibacter sp. AY1E6]|uniref:ABC transporter permease n=1 Tax=Rathayibacter sp. AY1E6 TaxID=2080554 RepID=UPI002157E27B|nr:ABC transporter permease [Rathayibacter sp. AY1E6]
MTDPRTTRSDPRDGAPAGPRDGVGAGVLDPVAAPGLRLRRPRLRLGRWSAPLGLLGAAVGVLWILIAVLAPVIAPHDPLAQDLPLLQAPGEGTLMGTDALGRDVFSRVIWGARVTIPLALLLVVMSVLIGAIVGSVAGFLGRAVDEVAMRITDLVMAFPTVILAMVIAAALGASLLNAVLAALIVSWPSYARLTRGLVLGLRSSNYVVSGQLLGFSPLRSLVRDIAPNIVGPVLVLASLDIGTAILLLSGLSFLGLGAKPPTAEWGSMVSDAIQNFDAWWIGVFPGLAILTIVIAFNFVGDALRDALDPRSQTIRGGGATL